VPVLSLTAAPTTGVAAAPSTRHALLRLAVYSGAGPPGAPAALTAATRVGVVETTWPALRGVADGTPLRASPAGVVTVGSVAVDAAPSLLDWLTDGVLDVSLVAAVDWTVANGPPAAATSLHHLPPAGAAGGAPPNVYEAVLAHVASTLAPYGSSAEVAAYGFGAALPPAGRVSHCFTLSGAAVSPLVDGAGGLRAAYRQALGAVTPAGPPVLAEVLNTAGVVASRRASASSAAGATASGGGGGGGGGGTRSLAYTVLTVVLAAPPEDLQAVKAALLRLATLPLSVFLVGVGRGGPAWDAFCAELDDGSRRPLLHGNVRAVRRAVAVVRVGDFGGGGAGDGAAAAAAAALNQLPGQIGEFCTLSGVPPPPSFPLFGGG